jgi:hypothetical protein
MVKISPAHQSIDTERRSANDRCQDWSLRFCVVVVEFRRNAMPKTFPVIAAANVIR